MSSKLILELYFVMWVQGFEVTSFNGHTLHVNIKSCTKLFLKLMSILLN